MGREERRMRLIDADALKELMIEVLEHIKENPKMDGQERHIIAGIHMLGEMIDDEPTVDAVPVEYILKQIAKLERSKGQSYNAICYRHLIEVWEMENEREEETK